MRFVITAGDCNGIGIEVLTKALAQAGGECKGIHFTILSATGRRLAIMPAPWLPVEITPKISYRRH